MRFWEGQSASLLGCVFSQWTFYIACHSMAWILSHLQMWLMIPCLAQSLKCGSILVLSSGVMQKGISSSVDNPTVPDMSVLPCRGGGAAKKQQIIFIPLLSSVPCRKHVGAELALSDREPVLSARVSYLSPLLHALSQMHSWIMLCSELMVKTWFAQKWVCWLYLTEARSSVCHERQIHDTQDKDYFRIMEKIYSYLFVQRDYKILHWI